MNIFVTGGSGFLGTRLIARSNKEGHTLSGLARGAASSKALEAAGVRSVAGTFSNIAEWESALQGIDAIVHCAAPVEFWGRWEDFYRDTVQASVDLLAAANRRGVKRFIHISSESVLQDKGSLLDVNETAPYPQMPNSIYGRAKKQAEIELLGADSKTTRILLRPTFIWGKGVKALDTLIDKVKSGQFMWIDGGQAIIEMVHVDNVVEAITLALSKGVDKEIFYVTDDRPMTARDFLSALMKNAGVTPPEKNMNGTVAAIAAALLQGIWKLLRIRKAPPLSPFELAFVAQPRRYDISKIKRVLGYRPVVSLEEGLAGMRN